MNINIDSDRTYNGQNNSIPPRNGRLRATSRRHSISIRDRLDPPSLVAYDSSAPCRRKSMADPVKLQPCISKSVSSNIDEKKGLRRSTEKVRESPVAIAPSINSTPLPPELSAASSEDQMIEIAPGFMARLRGAKETLACIQDEFYFPTKCCACDIDLCCILDADYVICPYCRVVSPLNSIPQDGGVALGFTVYELDSWT